MHTKKLLLTAAVLLLFTILYFVLQYIFIPENIYMTTGESYIVRLDTPFDGEISCSEALSINNERVSENIEKSVGESCEIKSENTAVADMRVKFMGLPFKKVELCFLPEKRVDVIGRTVGICVDTKGVLVLGTGGVRTDNGEASPCRGVVKSGDIILAVNGSAVENKEELAELVKNDDDISLKIQRSSKLMDVNVKAVRSGDDNMYRLGLWVRDSTQGIGTITYYDREDNRFGALGHPINDVDTGKLMEISGGDILYAEVERAEKGKSGSPGALIGKIDFDRTIGKVESNRENGVFGYMSGDIKGVELPVGYRNDIKTGDAFIFVNTKGSDVEKYSVRIDHINKYNVNDTKNFVLTVTDKRLLDMTGGIVQGMSGCPVVQNGKLVGAVTHVFVNDPTKGYGIFVENMLGM